jgi:hypothetical protein
VRTKRSRKGAQKRSQHKTRARKRQRLHRKRKQQERGRVSSPEDEREKETHSGRQVPTTKQARLLGRIHELEYLVQSAENEPFQAQACGNGSLRGGRPVHVRKDLRVPMRNNVLRKQKIVRQGYEPIEGQSHQCWQVSHWYCRDAEESLYSIVAIQVITVNSAW